MDIKDIDRVLATARASRGLKDFLEVAKPVHELAKLMQRSDFSKTARMLSESAPFHGEMQSLFASVRMSDVTLEMLDSMKSSPELLAALDMRRPSAEFSGWMASFRPTVEMNNLIRWAQAPLAPGICDLVREATAAQRAAEHSFPAPSEVSRIIDSLGQEMRLIGEFDLPGVVAEQDEDGGSDPALVLPAEAAERIARVEFLPIRVMDAIRDNPDEMRRLSGREFEEFIAELLHGVGFDSVQLTPSSGDGGCDVLAVQQVNGIPVFFTFECKDTERIERSARRFSGHFSARWYTLRRRRILAYSSRHRRSLGVRETSSLARH